MNTYYRDELRFAHYSVQEYLVSSRIGRGTVSHFAVVETVAHQLFARTTLIYILSFISTNVWQPYPPRQFYAEIAPLLRYSSAFWSYHLRASRSDSFDSPQYALTRRLFSPPIHKTFCEFWSNFIHSEHMNGYVDYDVWWGIGRTKDLESHDYGGLYNASLLGLTELCKWLVQEGMDVNSLYGDRPYRYSLIIAAATGEEATVELLLGPWG